MKQIDAQQLNAMQDRREDFLLVNTLPQEHFESTKIEGAVSIPQDQDDFVDQVAAKIDKSKPVVVYCASASCDSSVKAAEKLDETGFERVLEFSEGAEGWKKLQAESSAE